MWLWHCEVIYVYIEKENYVITDKYLTGSARIDLLINGYMNIMWWA